MEEKEKEESEPLDLRSGDQAELILLVISGEEDATQEESALRDESNVAKGHDLGDPRPDLLASVKSPCTSYWNITEGPDHPLLLSPVTRPSGYKPKVHRASRPGLSRIPGRDHRRYYHEYWRSEYLMDFDPQRHGMICMVCGSSLATLKLSTIKRHIRQKHPDSLLWSTADKEVIRSVWESHLSMEGGHKPYSSETPSPQEEKEQMESEQQTAESPGDASLQEEQLQPSSLSACSESHEAVKSEEREQDMFGPSAQTLERYLNDSLHAWFRQEFLMEYEAEAGRLLCMVCGGELPSLHLDHIKSHVLDTHPNSLMYSSEEKHCILQSWTQTHEELENSIKSEPSTKDCGVDLFAQELEAIQINTEFHPEGNGTFIQDTLIGEDGGVSALDHGSRLCHQSRKNELCSRDPWRLRLDYLVAYGPQGLGTFCMVCSRVLQKSKVSCFRRHIQECHPETTTLSRQEREAMAAAWTKECSREEIRDVEPHLSRPEVLNTVDQSPEVRKPGTKAKKEQMAADGGGEAKRRDGGAAAAPLRYSHYPGKDQRRNYQVRWRMEYLMDYDCRRHGLICMVCAATLATLKVSTIKRHIHQVHPHSLKYSTEEKQQVMLSYNQTALQLTHSDDCFLSQDHGQIELTAVPAHFST
ncbi:uncharacterized protein C11orf95 homolog isoform X1 [Takifugu rubripes]|uniref:uncharacterized protein C11orf95 homolog isoform X1 n=1 Tax=Takifugu rubripes TaxID=31033 RepID=UPI001145A093|nr:uncharacterized protein C11orf95 homolog isoform X1 [Takifugu rubripes]